MMELLIQRKGILTFLCVVFGLMLLFPLGLLVWGEIKDIGMVPSHDSMQTLILRENQVIMIKHSNNAEKDAMDAKLTRAKQLRLSLSNCVNPAIEKKDTVAGRICFAATDDSGQKQERLIEQAFYDIEKQKREDKP